MATLIIPSRFNGPPVSGNGGYTCGLFAEHIGACAEVTLRRPPPLERPLHVAREADTWQLLDGDALVASGRVAEPDVSVPAAPSFAAAQAAEAHYEGHKWHHFGTCFVCGTARAAGDGLRLFTGRLGDTDMVASSWLPDASVAEERGEVARAVVWSALDCPTYFAGRQAGYGRWAVLGRQTAALRSPVRVGEPHVVVAWPIRVDGRKWEGGSALFRADGALCAYARCLWIELPNPPPEFAR
jgi:hypothetical protein